MQENFKVIILCGGQGMRLREETEFRPKPMVEIGGRPILWHIMKIYSHYGFNDFVLCLGYKGEVIKQYFLNYDVLNTDVTIELGTKKDVVLHNSGSEHGWRITLVNTGEQAMTGARVKRVEKYVHEDVFLLTYGDGVADVNLTELVHFHRSHGKLATVTGVRPRSRFGELLTEGRQVTHFSEKPQTGAGCINGGFFVFNRGFFNYLSHENECTLEGEPLERVARDGQLMVYEHAGFWECMDTYRDFVHLNEVCKSGYPPWMVWR